MEGKGRDTTFIDGYIERAKQRERETQFDVDVVRPPESGSIPRGKGQFFRSLHESEDGGPITLVPVDISDDWYK